MKRILVPGVVLLVACSFVLLGLGSAFAAEPTSVDRSILEILKQKGLLTEKEYETLKAQEEKEQKAKAWTEKIEVGYKDGAFIKTKDDRFLLRLNTAIQPFFLYEAFDDRPDVTRFQLRRARLYARGNAFYPWLKYDTQLTLEGTSVALRDYTLEVTSFKEVQPKFGQFKVPFDREFLTSGFSLQLIERSIASAEFSLQRDIGIQLSGHVAQGLLEYRVGIFNSSGANQNNVDKDYMYIGRLAWTPLGDYPYSQAALDHPTTPRLALGVAVAYLPGLEPGERKILAGRLGAAGVVPVESDVVQVTADLAFKYLGFSLEGAYHFRNIDPKAPTKFGSVDATGFFIQAGYFLIPKHFEVAARYSFVDPDNPTSVSDNHQHEGTVGASYYFFGHKLKAQANYTFQSTETPTKTLDDHIMRVSVVFQF